jgi:hypothetical protein
MTKPLLVTCFEQAREAVQQLDQIQAQYKQGRELHGKLQAGEVPTGTLFLQPVDGDVMQLPLPDKDTLINLLASSGAHLNAALHAAWTDLLKAAEQALAAIPAPPPPPEPS